MGNVPSSWSVAAAEHVIVSPTFAVDGLILALLVKEGTVLSTVTEEVLVVVSDWSSVAVTEHTMVSVG